MKYGTLLVLLVIGTVCVGCGQKEEVLDASPVATQAPKTPPAPVAGKPKPSMGGSDNPMGTPASGVTPQ